MAMMSRYDVAMRSVGLASSSIATIKVVPAEGSRNHRDTACMLHDCVVDRCRRDSRVEALGQVNA